ncbi:MAG: peptidoglycan-binding domain-containing protein [Mesorhizobium sp.]|nr:peptidoglycan-binding domain-containing protein [Mesorhizobium sp.]
MRPSESRLDDTSPLAGLMRDALFASGAAISRNPLLVGGATAFLVTLFFVSANALWNQPQPHTSTFFVTREPAHSWLPAAGELDAGEEDAEDGASAAPVRHPDPVVQQVQDILGDLNLYTGSIDGIAGPQTRAAVESYQRSVGREASGQIDARLLAELMARRAEPAPSDVIVTPAPRPAATQLASTDGAVPQERIIKIQAGLKAFGHDGIEIDGVIGLKTSSAIREFQSLFGLPVTGKPDEALLAKMREIGLTN